MPNRVSAFDQCLDLLRQGVRLEDCLQRFPKQRDELEPLLRMATRVSASYVPAQMSPQAFSRGRAQFLSQAVQIKEQEKPQAKASWAFWGSRPMLARSLATVFLTLTLLAGLLTGGNIVSANSLPGDTLYGVKRTSERVQLLLAVGPETKSRLEDKFSERRLDEVRQVLEEGRQVDVDFSGVIDRIEGDLVFVEGIPIRLDPRIMLDQAPQVGSRIAIVAEAQDNGYVEAVSVKTEPTLAGKDGGNVGALPVPTKEPTATATVQEKPTDKPTSTPKPTDTIEPTPTWTMTPTATMEESTTITPTATISATMTEMPTMTPTPTNTMVPTATPTPPPPPRSVKIRIEGRIDEITGGHWKVNGQRVLLNSSTSIKQDQAKAEIGGWAVVTAVKEPDGDLIAKEIVVLRAAEEPPAPIEFSGEIQQIDDSLWVISGHAVVVDGNTVVEGTPRVGAGAFVKAERYADGHLLAKLIRVEDEPEVVQFEGRIQAIGETEWTIAGQKVLVNGNTKIEGKPMVGAIAEVEAIVQADSSKLARSIRVKTPVEPTPSPTATGEPQPTTTPSLAATTPTPTETLAPQPTLSATETPEPTAIVPDEQPTPSGELSNIPTRTSAE